MRIFRLTQLALVASAAAAWAIPAAAQSSASASAAPQSGFSGFHGGHMSPPSRDFHAPRSPGGSVGVGVPSRRHQDDPVTFGRHFGDSGFGMDFGFQDDFKHRGHPRHPWPGKHRGGWVGYWGYWGDGDGYVDTIPTPDQFGFFAQDSGVSFDGERATYHYDRGYPYEWFDPKPGMHSAGPRRVAVNCQVELVPSGRGSLDVPVRVCRGS